MDAIIANTAKHCNFDAAHYTWLYVDMDVVRKYSNDKIKELLVQHGDYATPLHTESILQPFDNMALVLRMGVVRGEETFFTIIVHSNKGSLVSAELRTSHLPPGVAVMSLYFKPVRDNVPLLEKAKKEGVTEFSPGKPIDKQALIEFHKTVPAENRKMLIDYFVPTLRHALAYIPAASDGLLAGESVSYHKPVAAGNNAKRIRKGKAPMYEWVTVQLERKTPELPAAPKGGTHASPRLHQRRGHWVTSKLGKKFWRSETVVGKPENGMVFHDYVSKEKGVAHE